MRVKHEAKQFTISILKYKIHRSCNGQYKAHNTSVKFLGPVLVALGSNSVAKVEPRLFEEPVCTCMFEFLGKICLSSRTRPRTVDQTSMRSSNKCCMCMQAKAETWTLATDWSRVHLVEKQSCLLYMYCGE